MMAADLARWIVRISVLKCGRWNSYAIGKTSTQSLNISTASSGIVWSLAMMDGYLI